MQLSGQFKVIQWQESTKAEFDNGSKLNTADIEQSYTGDIVGSSKVSYQLHYDTQSSSTFNGFEQLECEVQGVEIQGTQTKGAKVHLVLIHRGVFKNGIASSQFEILEARGMDELVGKTGSFEAAMGQDAHYQIEV